MHELRRLLYFMTWRLRYARMGELFGQSSALGANTHSHCIKQIKNKIKKWTYMAVTKEGCVLFLGLVRKKNKENGHRS